MLHLYNILDIAVLKILGTFLYSDSKGREESCHKNNRLENLQCATMPFLSSVARLPVLLQFSGKPCTCLAIEL